MDGQKQTQQGTDGYYSVSANTWHYVTIVNKPSDGFSSSKVWIPEITDLDEITPAVRKEWASDSTIKITMKRIVEKTREPDKDFSLTYEIDSGPVPFQPTNKGLSTDEKEAYQLTKSVKDRITTFTIASLPDINTYTYYVEETSSTGTTLYNTHYGSLKEGVVVYAPGAKYDASGEGIINQEYSGYELPSTGGPGTESVTVLGSILITGAGLLLWKRREIL